MRAFAQAYIINKFNFIKSLYFLICSEFCEVNPLCTEGSGSACAEEREPSRIFSVQVHSDSVKSVRREIFTVQVAILAEKWSAGKR